MFPTKANEVDLSELSESTGNWVNPAYLCHWTTLQDKTLIVQNVTDNGERSKILGLLLKDQEAPDRFQSDCESL